MSARWKAAARLWSSPSVATTSTTESIGDSRLCRSTSTGPWSRSSAGPSAFIAPTWKVPRRRGGRRLRKLAGGIRTSGRNGATPARRMHSARSRLRASSAPMRQATRAASRGASAGKRIRTCSGLGHLRERRLRAEPSAAATESAGRGRWSARPASRLSSASKRCRPAAWITARPRPGRRRSAARP